MLYVSIGWLASLRFPPHCGGHYNQHAHVICSYDMTKHKDHMMLILQAREANYRLNLILYTS